MRIQKKEKKEKKTDFSLKALTNNKGLRNTRPRENDLI